MFGTNVLCSLWDIPLRRSWVTRLSKNLFDLSTKRLCRMSSQPALRGDETANFDFPLMTKSGARRVILLNATVRRDEFGNIIGVVGIGQDITERIAQEREFFKLIYSANAVSLKSQEKE